jgi:hypothetical protein
MPVNKKIIKISQEQYNRLKQDYGTLLDLYIQDNDYYVIGKLEDLKSLDLDLDIPFY